MATALDMITRAMRLIGAIGDGETPSSYEAQTGLDALNTMLDSWSLDELTVYQIQQQNFSITVGTGTYTIGTGGAFNGTRPVQIRGAFFRDSNSLDFPLEVVEKPEYNRLAQKTDTGYTPEYLYYSPAYPLGSISLYPVPAAAGSLYLDSLYALQSFATLTTAVSLPPGYQRAIEFNLALEIAPEFERDVPASVERNAVKSKAAIERINAPAPVLLCDAALVTPGRFNIFEG